LIRGRHQTRWPCPPSIGVTAGNGHPSLLREPLQPGPVFLTTSEDRLAYGVQKRQGLKDAGLRYPSCHRAQASFPGFLPRRTTPRSGPYGSSWPSSDRTCRVASSRCRDRARHCKAPCQRLWRGPTRGDFSAATLLSPASGNRRVVWNRP